MDAESHKRTAGDVAGGDGQLDELMRPYDWSQTPLGKVETWSTDLKAAVQDRLTELAQVQPHEKIAAELDLSWQISSQTPASHQSAETDTFRVALSDALRLLTDATEIQSTAARILGEYLGASRVIYIEVLPNGEQVLVHKNYTNGVAELGGLYRLEDFGRNLTSDHAAGQTVRVPDVANSTQYTAIEKMRYQAVDIAAYIDVPLIKNNQFVALLAVHQKTPRAWTERETQWVEETAERTWAAVERARAEVALRESEAQYRTLFESMDEGFCLCEMLFSPEGHPVDYRFLEVNAVFEQLTGLQQAKGHTARELVPDLETYWFELYGKVVRTREPTRFEQQSVALNRWFSVNAFCIGEPQLNQFAVLFANITEVKRVESERQAVEATLRASEERFRTLISASSNMLYQMTADWSEMRKLDGGNFMVDTAEPSRDWLHKYIHPDDQAQVLESISTAIETKQLLELEHRVQCIDGTVGWTYSRVVPLLDSAGNIVEWFGEARDISDRKRIEVEREQILQRERAARETAERANRVKDEFLAVLSHELRSPLNPILGWTQLLRNGKLDATRQAKALKTIERNAKLQSQLIEDLLDISRIMQGKLTLTAGPVSLAGVIAAALETVQLAAEAKQIEITLDLDSAVTPISGDAARLQQVVWNLLTNAVKFTPAGGQVIVELKQLDRLAQIRITDPGKGMQPEFLPDGFEYFRQEDGSTTRKFGGLGLGLAIVKQLVELHGGTVKAESDGENRGATFVVQLPSLQPLQSLDSERLSETRASEACLENVRILLVDDDTDAREFQSFLLEQSGATVITTASAAEALLAIDRSIADGLPDVIVSDIGMAGIDGYMLIQQIRSRSPGQGGAIPAIALTAYAAEVDQKKALQAGFQKHLTKPLEPEQFVREILSLLQPNKA